MDLIHQGPGLLIWQIVGFLAIAGIVIAGVKLYLALLKYLKNKNQ
ncbi:hypothetical protein [Echinicola sediminis]